MADLNLRKLDDSAYDLLIDGVNDGDLEAENRVLLLGEGDRTGLKERVKIRKAQDTGIDPVRISRYQELKRQETQQPEYFNTSEGGVIKDEPTIGQRYASVPGKILDKVMDPVGTIGGMAIEGANIGMGMAAIPAQLALGAPPAPHIPTGGEAVQWLNPQSAAREAHAMATTRPEPVTNAKDVLTGVIKGPFESAARMITEPDVMVGEHPLESIMNVAGAAGIARAMRKTRGNLPPQQPPPPPRVVEPPVAPETPFQYGEAVQPELHNAPQLQHSSPFTGENPAAPVLRQELETIQGNRLNEAQGDLPLIGPEIQLPLEETGTVYRPLGPQGSNILPGAHGEGRRMGPPPPQQIPTTPPTGVAPTTPPTLEGGSLTTAAEAARQRLRERARGTRVSSEFEAIGGSLADYAIIGADYLAQGIRDFSSWSKKMLEDHPEVASRLQDIFNRSQLIHSQVANPTLAQFATNLTASLNSPNPPPMTPSAVARVGIEVAEPASRFATALMRINDAQMEHVRNNVERLQGGMGDPIKSANYVDTLFSMTAELIEKQAYSRPRTWREAMFTTPTMDSAATKHIAAARSAFVMATQAWELGGPKEIFARGTTHMERPRVIASRTRNALKLLWDDRAQALLLKKQTLTDIQAQLRAELETLRTSTEEGAPARRLEVEAQLKELPDPEDIGTTSYPMLDSRERAAILTDPAMQDFATWFRDAWTPIVESMSTDAGIQKRLYGPLGGYISFADAWVDAQGTPATLRGQGSRSPYDVRPRRPKSARPSTGHVPEHLALSDDLFKYFYNTLADRMVATTKRDLMAELKTSALSTARTMSPLGEIPLRHTIIQTSRGPRKVPVRAITLEKLGGITDDVYFVPEPYAQLFDYAVKAPTKNELIAMDRISSALTAQIVVLPAEAVRHGWNVMSAVTTTEWYRKYGHTARMAEALSGAHGKMAIAMYKAFNLHGSELTRHIQELADNNGLRLSSWEHSPEHGGIVQLASSGRYNPLRLLKESIFAYPGVKKGVKGMETRLRVAIKIAMEEADPTMRDPAIGRRINASLGTYVKEVVPPLAEGLQKFYPFARARTALTRQGFATAAGMDILGKFNPYIATATTATVAQILIANKLFDDKGRWPWEIPGWTPLSLGLFEWNGHRVSIGADLVFNALYRAIKAVPISRAVELALNGTPDGSGTYLKELSRTQLNYITSWAGPLATTAMVAGTGSIPYVGADGKLMSMEETAMSGSEHGKGHARLKAIIKSVSPASGKAMEWADSSGYTPRPTTEPWNTAFTVAELFGIAPQISGAHSEDRAQGATYFRSVAEARQVGIEALTHARNLSTDPGQQVQYIRDYINRHTNRDMIVMDGDKPKPANIFALEIALSALKNQTPRREKGKVLARQPALR